MPFNAFVIIRGIESGNRKFLVSWLLSGHSRGDRGGAIDINAGYMISLPTPPNCMAIRGRESAKTFRRI